MRRFLYSALLSGLTSLSGCATLSPPATPSPSPPIVTGAPRPLLVRPFFAQTGMASFYGAAHDGKLTADGESFDPQGFTAAHRSLAFGTVVRVTNLANGLTVKVEINDRGPHSKGRIIDLSAAAARALGMRKNGIARVRLEAFRADQSKAG
ncbi:MAG TPA: septal ring lytic transglycosylase RlpA family protein [Rhizomicrobium sp.]|nr:septal ring lytic transglycosylase RlpA family protein [Rhizomicrobium sp.]